MFQAHRANLLQEWCVLVCVCLFNNLPALNLLSLPLLQGASMKASAVWFFFCFILEPSFLQSPFVFLDQCSTKGWSQVGLKYREPVRPPLSADKSVSELGSTLQYTGFVFFFQVCPGFCFPSSPCISTVRVGRFHRPALCGCRRLFLSVQCLQPGSTRDMWRVYPSPHGCFTSLSSLLNVQVISSPLLTSVKLAEPRALPVHLILRSLCKLTPLQIQRPPWQ